MKINELVNDFTIYLSNEENSLLKKVTGTHNLLEFSERDQFTMQSLINKSLISKIQSDGQTFVRKNAQRNC